VIEAMANARPVLATRVGGVVDLVGEPVEPSQQGRDAYTVCERGVLVPSDAAEAFCSGLERLVEDAALRRRLGQRARRFVECQYSKERLITDVAHLYHELTMPAAAAQPTSLATES
jgi:glycosyltransferase involved in cell wall biosynthesis